MLVQSETSAEALAPLTLPLGRTAKLSYGAGEIGSNLAWTFVTGFLLLYYSDVALLPVASLGTLMLVTRILDAVFDPLVGLVMDRTSSWLGKARPYLLFGCLPFGLALVATFAVPDWSPQARLIYAYASFTLLGLFYSIVYVPYSALLPLMTADGREKVQLGSIRAMASSVGSITVYGATLPIVAWAGGASRGYTLAAAIMAVLMVACMLVTVAVCRERPVQVINRQRTPLSVSLKAMMTNRRWRVAFASAVLLFVRISVTVTSLIYFVKDVLEKPQLIGILLPLFSVAILIGGGLSGLVFQRMDMRRANLMSLALAMAALAVAAMTQHSPLVFVIAFLVANMFSGFQTTAIFVMISDAVEAEAERSGIREDGLFVSSISFSVKAGLAFGTALTAYVLGWSGYQPGHVEPEVATAITWLFFAGPAVVIALNMLVLSRGRESEQQ